MPDHIVHFEKSQTAPTLSRAILLYGAQQSYGRRSTPSFASIHPVHIDDAGKAEIGAGAPLTRSDLRHWSKILGQQNNVEILPENVLVSHQDVLAWWTPARTRTGYFNLSDDAEMSCLKGETIVQVPVPAHLFIATHKNLGVYALAQNKRPCGTTVPLYSPILNVFVSGNLCWGNIERVKSLTPSAIPAYEAAVFDSWSTHANPNQDATLRRTGGLAKLWDELAATKAKTFPTKLLKPFGQVVTAKVKSANPRSTAPNLTVQDLIRKAAA